MILRQKIIFFSIVEGGANIFEVFRVKNHDFTPKKKSHFFPILGGGARRVILENLKSYLIR
jgi:Zn/Cd-binding protein ZinT